MVAIVKDDFRFVAKEMFNAAIENGDYAFYTFISKPSEWTNENTPPLPVDDVRNYYRIFDEMIALKKIAGVDVVSCIPRNDWQTGVIYDMYRDNYSDDNPAQSGAESLFDSSFYVLTNDFNIYKCIDNNGDSASTVEPTGTSTNIFETADGYRWKYMYTIAAGDVLKFVTPDFVIVKNAPTIDDGSAQWDVQDTAIDGGIHHVDITAGGSGYATATVAVAGDGTGFTATATVDAGAVTSIEVTDPGTGYTRAVVTISGDGTGATASAVISPRGGHGFDAVRELGGFYSMINARLEYNDGAGDFPVTNDFRTLGIIVNPISTSTDLVLATTTASAMKSITLTGDPTVAYSPDEIIEGQTSSAQAYVVEFDADNNIIKYVQNDDTGYTPFTDPEDIVGLTTTATGTVDTLNDPEIVHYKGDVIYIENRRAISRASDQLESISIVITW